MIPRPIEESNYQGVVARRQDAPPLLVDVEKRNHIFAAQLDRRQVLPAPFRYTA
jgi:hypothetical protein